MVDSASGAAPLCSEIVKYHNEKLNRDYIINFLASDEVYDGTTTWENIYEILPGFSIFISIFYLKCEFRLNDNFFFAKPVLDPAAILEEYINKNCGDDNVVIEFSGGLDSTALLYAACMVQKKSQIKALTWHHPDISAKEDINASQYVCQKLGIEHVKYSIKTEELFILDSFDHTITAPNLSLMFYMTRKKSHQICLRGRNDYSFINGHGGDHLFFDPPHYSSLINAYVNKGAIFAAKNLYQYSVFTGIPILQVVKKLIIHKRRSKEQNHYDTFYRHCSEKNSLDYGSKELIIAIIQAIFENQRSCPAKVFTPFTCKNMINFSLSRPTYESFNKTQKRIHFKKDIYFSYGKDTIIRNSKGHITGIYQKYFQQNAEKIKYIIEHDTILNTLNIDKKKYYALTNLNVHMGSGISLELMRFLSLSLFIKNIKFGGYYD